MADAKTEDELRAALQPRQEDQPQSTASCCIARLDLHGSDTQCRPRFHAGATTARRGSRFCADPGLREYLSSQPAHVPLTLLYLDHLALGSERADISCAWQFKRCSIFNATLFLATRHAAMNSSHRTHAPRANPAHAAPAQQRRSSPFASEPASIKPLIGPAKQ